MAVPKPVAGYPSKTAAILGLAARGYCNRRIAEEIGSTRNAVATVRSRVRQHRAGYLPVRLDHSSTIRALALAAVMRGIPTELLISRLLTAIAHDGLIDAVLDDHDEDAA